MKEIGALSREELLACQKDWQEQYARYAARGLKLDMSRGKPCPEQLDLTASMLDSVSVSAGCTTHDGLDVRNYGMLEGIPEARRMFSDMLGVPAENVLIGGNSSLNLMYDYLAAAYIKGIMGHPAWCRQGQVKFLCPAPGYDRHFAITEFLGIEMVTVEMTDTGPDMDAVERLVRDPAVKGIWCVPMYANPTGVTYSDETVRRLAALSPAAPDFRIMWDNAYCLHHLTDTPDTLLNLYEEAERAGHPDLPILFASTSKISFPGSGIAALAASPANVADIRRRLTVQTIGYDKLNMLRHTRFFRDLNHLQQHMRRHAEILRPKFETVLRVLEEELGGSGIARWSRPNGGYFISVDLMDGCAARTAELLKQAGVTITGAGATYPYGRDPHDSNLRLAPSYPPVEELQTAMELFCLCAKLSAAERLLAGPEQ